MCKGDIVKSIYWVATEFNDDLAIFENSYMVLVQGLGGSWEGETSRDSARGMADSICFVVLIFFCW